MHCRRMPQAACRRRPVVRWPAHLAQASQPVKLFASQLRAQEAQAPSSALLRGLPAERQRVLRRLPPTPFTYRADPCDVAARAVAGSPGCCCCANRDASQGLTARSIEV